MTDTEPKVHDLQGQTLNLEEFIGALPDEESNVKISQADLLDFLKAVSVNIESHGIRDTGACVRNICGFRYWHACGKLVNFLVESAIGKGSARAEKRDLTPLFHANNFKGVSGRMDIVTPYDAEELVNARK